MTLLLVSVLWIVASLALGLALHFGEHDDELRPPERPISPSDWGRR